MGRAHKPKTTVDRTLDVAGDNVLQQGVGLVDQVLEYSGLAGSKGHTTLGFLGRWAMGPIGALAGARGLHGAVDEMRSDGLDARGGGSVVDAVANAAGMVGALLGCAGASSASFIGGGLAAGLSAGSAADRAAHAGADYRHGEQLMDTAYSPDSVSFGPVMQKAGRAIGQESSSPLRAAMWERGMEWAGASMDLGRLVHGTALGTAGDLADIARWSADGGMGESLGGWLAETILGAEEGDQLSETMAATGRLIGDTTRLTSPDAWGTLADRWSDVREGTKPAPAEFFGDCQDEYARKYLEDLHYERAQPAQAPISPTCQNWEGIDIYPPDPKAVFGQHQIEFTCADEGYDEKVKEYAVAKALYEEEQANTN